MHKDDYIDTIRYTAFMEDYIDAIISARLCIIKEDTDNNIEEKIEKSDIITNNDTNIIIIKDFLDDNNPDYGLDELEDLWYRYNMLPTDMKKHSNSYSLSIWHNTVPQMYYMMRSKILKDTDTLFDANKIDKVLYQYEEELNESANTDRLSYLKKKLESYLPQSSFYESTILEHIASNSKYNNSVDYDKDIPSITPFLSFNEYKELNDVDDISPVDYIMVSNPSKYYDTIHSLQTMMGTDKESIAIEQLLKLGWNPVVEINAESIKYARNKQVEWMNTHLPNIDIVNLSEYTTNITEAIDIATEERVRLEPVFIVLSYQGSIVSKAINKYTKSNYSHAGLSLDSRLSSIYSYNIKESGVNGLIVESIDDYIATNPNGSIVLLTLFVYPEVKDKLRYNLKWYLDNKDKTAYSYKNIGRLVLNKKKDSAYSLQLICSEFVDMMLKMCNIDITNKSSNLVAPADFLRSSNNVNVFILYEGLSTKYDYRKIDNIISSMIRNTDIDNLIVSDTSTVLKKVESCLIEEFNIDSEDKNISNILKEMRDCIKPSSSIILNEVKSPIGFNNKGSLYIAIPEDLEEEYNEAHKLLSLYNESNIQGIKHELARLFYINSIVERKLKKLKKTNPKRKELSDLRSKILYDFNTYFKIVINIEKDFNFTEYLKSTDYYNKSVEIDDSTLKYSGKYIKKTVDELLKFIKK